MRSFAFPLRQPNPKRVPAPYLTVVLTNPETREEISVWALIDTGADKCALPASMAESLGHTLDKGSEKHLLTANGLCVAYRHTLNIAVLPTDGITGEASMGSTPLFKTDNMWVDFLPHLGTPLLGVRNFLSHFIVTIDYPNSQFSLTFQESYHPPS